MHVLLLVGLAVLDGSPGMAQNAVKQVLVLQTFDRGNLVLDNFTANFRAGLDEHAGNPVNVVQVVVGPTGFVIASEQDLVDYIRSIYADRPPPDLIVTVGGPAAAFARKHRQQLFRETPVLFGSVDERWLRNPPLGENESAVAVANDFPGFIDDILRLLPETRQIFLVIGSGPIVGFWRQDLEVEFARFRNRVSFVWSDHLSLADILRQCASLPDGSAIVYLAFSADAEGSAYADEQVLAALRAAANAPLFARQGAIFGYGIVGGAMLPISDLGRNTGHAAARILNGESPASVRVPVTLPAPPVFDWRELQRWNIAERRLPPGSDVQFRPPSLWDTHRAAVLIALGALLLQSLLIARLLYEHRARQRAERESRRNLSLAADANRRETISALTTSIGHELGQPLSAIAQNAQALQLMVTDNRASAEATTEILADIQAEADFAARIIGRHRTMLRSRQLQKTPIRLDSVIDESLAMVAHDMRERQIVATLDLSSTPCVVDGDHVLLQQVFVNLMRNAIDALCGAPPARRQVTIRSAVRRDDVEVSVCDTGTGLPADIIATLFTPFVTTKSNGLGIGLAVTRTIVEAHGGTINARENFNGGAIFTVTLPRSTAAVDGDGR